MIGCTTASECLFRKNLKALASCNTFAFCLDLFGLKAKLNTAVSFLSYVS